MESSWGRQRSLRISKKSLALGLGIASITGLATTLIVTNPNQSTYESYATQRVINLLDKNICAEAPQSFNLQQDCKTLLKSNRTQIKEFIANNTQRQDFLFFSVYTTDVSVASFLPKYRIETVGVFRQFYIYETLED